MAVSVVEGDWRGIPYRAFATDRVDDDGRVWLVEYQQTGREPWGPRGSFRERNGKFYAGAREFDSAYLALMSRATGV